MTTIVHVLCILQLIACFYFSV